CPTFFRSAARGLHDPAARRAASRKTRRGSAGPANGRESAAAKSWAANLHWCRATHYDVSGRERSLRRLVSAVNGEDPARLEFRWLANVAWGGLWTKRRPRCR